MLKSEKIIKEIEVQKITSYCDVCGVELESKEVGLSSTKNIKFNEHDAFPYSKNYIFDTRYIGDKKLILSKTLCPKCHKKLQNKLLKVLIQVGYENVKNESI